MPVIQLSAALYPSFRFLLGQLTRFHRVAKNTFGPLHGQFGVITQAIADLFLPSDTAILVNEPDMAVPLAIACR